MLREFSKELQEDRDFEFGGKVYTFRYPHWEEAVKIMDEDLELANENGDFKFTWAADTKKAIERIPTFLTPDSAAQFKKDVKDKTNEMPRHQIVGLYRWLVRVTSDLPTTPPSDLPPGGGANDDSSEEESS